MFGLNGNPWINFESQTIALNYVFFLLAAVIACTPLPRILYHKLTSSSNGAAIAAGTVLEYALPVAGLVFSISYLVGTPIILPLPAILTRKGAFSMRHAKQYKRGSREKPRCSFWCFSPLGFFP